MAEVRWTKEQQEAIAIRHADTLVSAAAGSGKTAVLVERVIQMITDPDHPIDVDKLLVVTFTNAAARQMKQKIAAALVKEIEKHPQHERLRRQLALLGNAGIHTMHAFCLTLVKQHFQNTELPYDFKIADPAEGAMLRQDALEETFGEFYETQGTEFGELVEWFGGKDDQPLMKLILQLYEFVRSIPFYRNWLKQAVTVPESGIFETVWGRFLKNDSIQQLQLGVELAKQTVERLRGLDESHGLVGYIETFSQDEALLSEALEQVKEQDWDSLVSWFGALKFSTIKRVAKDGNAELAEEFKKTRQHLKDIVGELKEMVFFQKEQECLRDLAKAVHQNAFLIQVLERFEVIYAEKKRQRSLVDFGDLEHLSIGILSEWDHDGALLPSPVAMQLRSQYEEVLIDEYQDTNDVQELIFSLVAGDRKRFMVGDIKQSIYGFRNSKPALFLEKYHQYSKQEGQNDRRLLLSKNFRSRETVLSCCNFVFSRLMCKECGGLDYTAEESLYFGGGYPEGGPPVELFLLDGAQEEDDMTSQEREADLCARRIFEMVTEQMPLFDHELGEMRPCQYGDFTVLLRSVASRSELYANAFSQYGIPYELEKGSAFFESLEVKLAVALLQIIDNPRQDIPLLSVLRSPMFGFDDDVLTAIRLKQGLGDYYDCLVQTAQEGNEKAVLFLEQLNSWRVQSETLRVGKLLDLIYEESGILLYYSQKSDGEVRKNRLLLLSRWARSFENTSYRGLFHFVTYLRRQMELAEEGVTMADTTTHGNAVTLMSIHKSKGLEANIIFICDCGKQFNKMDMTSRLLMDDALGLGSDCVDTEHHIIYETFAKKAVKLKKRQELQAEELRLLYVAMTRAKQKLVLMGSIKHSKLAGIRSLVTGKGFEPAAVLNANCYLDWLLSAFVFHPQAAAIRSYGITSGISDEPGFSLEIKWNLKETQLEPSSQQQERFEEEESFSLEPLEYQYPYEKVCMIPAKLSVSEMKRRYDPEQTEEGWIYYPKEIAQIPLPNRPEFLRGNNLTPTERGTVYHTVFQYLDLTCLSDKEKTLSQLEKLVSKGRIKPEAMEEIDLTYLLKFSKSPLYDLICNADQLEREKRFLLPFPAKELFEGGGEEKLLIQGMIDCLVQHEGEYTLIDYKTDWETDPELAKKRYGMQLHLYSMAVQQIYGKLPKDCWIYFVKTGETIRIDT